LEFKTAIFEVTKVISFFSNGLQDEHLKCMEFVKNILLPYPRSQLTIGVSRTGR
jgi:hypothetical protein